jgi:hypothetical protein
MAETKWIEWEEGDDPDNPDELMIDFDDDDEGDFKNGAVTIHASG